MDNKVGFCYLLLILKEKVLSIPGAKAYLIYIVTQLTITEKGKKVLKYRLCYDLSFSL